MAVRDLHERRGDDRSFIATLARNINCTWIREPIERPFEGVYRRDRYRCQSPTCRVGRPDLDPRRSVDGRRSHAATTSTEGRVRASHLRQFAALEAR